MPHKLLVKDKLKGFRKAGNQSYRAVVRKIERSPFFRYRSNMSKPPAKRIGRSRERQTKKFDHEMSEFGSIVFENNGRESIRTVSFPRIKAR